MKKVIIILFLFAFSLLTYKGKVENAFIEKIDLKLQEEEIGIVFIPMNKSSFLLIKTKENSIILPIYGKENPQKILERFGEEKPTYSYTDIINGENKVEEQNLQIENINIKKNNKNYTISNENINFCIFYEGNIQNCDYIYFVNETSLSESKIKLAFYNEDLSSTFENELYNHWIDVYKIKKKEFTLFTLHKDTYNVIKLPNYYFQIS